jgi:hypothetical protein
MSPDMIETVKKSKGFKVGTGLSIAVVLAILAMVGYEITENTYYCPDTGIVLECPTIAEEGTLCEKELCPSGWQKVQQSEPEGVTGGFTLKDTPTHWIVTRSTDNARIKVEGNKVCISSDKAKQKQSEAVYDKKGQKLRDVQKEAKLIGGKQEDAFCYDTADEKYLKFGNESTIIVYNNSQTFNYEPEFANVTIYAEKLIGEDWELVVGTFNITCAENNTVPCSFWLRDDYAVGNSTYRFRFESSSPLYTNNNSAVWLKNPTVRDMGFYSMVDTELHTYDFKSKPDDVCSINGSDCVFDFNGTNGTLTFTSNGTIDPSLDVSYDSDTSFAGWQTNRTEATDHGIRSHAPLLFMDFNNAPEGTYVQDNSIYNNFGTNNGATYNSSCGSSGMHDLGGCYEFDGVDDFVNVADSNSLDVNDFTISLWFSPDNVYNTSVDYVQGLIDKGSYKIFLDQDGKLKAEVVNTMSSWTTSYNGAEEFIISLAVYDGKLYAGQGGGIGDGDVLVFDGSIWGVSYNGAQKQIRSYTANEKIYCSAPL